MHYQPSPVPNHQIEEVPIVMVAVPYRDATGNQVSVIVMGVATHGLKTQHFVATVPIKVAMDAPCTVILVKQSLPFEQLAVREDEETQDPEASHKQRGPGSDLYGDDLWPLE